MAGVTCAAVAAFDHYEERNIVSGRPSAEPTLFCLQLIKLGVLKIFLCVLMLVELDGSMVINPCLVNYIFFFIKKSAVAEQI